MEKIYRNFIYLLFPCLVGSLMNSAPVLAEQIIKTNKSTYQVKEDIDIKFNESFTKDFSKKTVLILLRKDRISKIKITYDYSSVAKDNDGIFFPCCPLSPLLRDTFQITLEAPRQAGQYELVLFLIVNNQIQIMDRETLLITAPQILEELEELRFVRCTTPTCGQFEDIGKELPYGTIFFLEAHYALAGQGLPDEKVAQLLWDGVQPKNISLKRQRQLGQTSIIYRSDPIKLKPVRERK